MLSETWFVPVISIPQQVLSVCTLCPSLPRATPGLPGSLWQMLESEGWNGVSVLITSSLRDEACLSIHWLRISATRMPLSILVLPAGNPGLGSQRN